MNQGVNSDEWTVHEIDIHHNRRDDPVFLEWSDDDDVKPFHITITKNRIPICSICEEEDILGHKCVPIIVVSDDEDVFEPLNVEESAIVEDKVIIDDDQVIDDRQKLVIDKENSNQLALTNPLFKGFSTFTVHQNEMPFDSVPEDISHITDELDSVPHQFVKSPKKYSFGSPEHEVPDTNAKKKQHDSRLQNKPSTSTGTHKSLPRSILQNIPLAPSKIQSKDQRNSLTKTPEQLSHSPKYTASTSGNKSLRTLEQSHSTDDDKENCTDERRVVDIHYYTRNVLQASANHLLECTGELQFLRSETQTGFTNTTVLECRFCKKIYNISTDKESKLKKQDINYEVVKASMKCNVSFKQINFIVRDAMKVHFMSQKTFTTHQEAYEDKNNTNMKNANVAVASPVQEKRNIAIDNKQTKNEAEGITVYIHAGWNLRDNKPRYNVVVIINQHSKKLLYLGVQGKYCSMCKTSNHNTPKDHPCILKNTILSTEEILIKVITFSKHLLGVHIKKFIGPSGSVCDVAYKYILAEVNKKKHINITKQDNSDDIIMSQVEKLYKLGGTDEISKAGGQVVVRQMVCQLTKTVKSVVQYHSGNGATVDTLVRDLKIIPAHIFAKHENCKEYFCNNTSENELVPKLGVSTVYNYVTSYMKFLVENAKQLLEFTTVVDEDIYRYHMALYNPLMSENSEKPISGLLQSKRKCNEPSVQTSKVSKSSTSKEVHSPLIAAIPNETIELAKAAILEEIHITQKEIQRIAEICIDNVQVDFFKNVLRYRINSTFFGEIYQKRNTSHSLTLLKRILKSNSVHGPQEFNERTALKRFAYEQNRTYKDCGIFIDNNHKYLCGKPTAIMSDEFAIVEVKCVNIPPESNFYDMVNKKPNFDLKQKADGTLFLRDTSVTYRKIQGILNICCVEKCYFIMSAGPNFPLHIEMIYRDKKLWSEIVEKLTTYYYFTLLPELAKLH